MTKAGDIVRDWWLERLRPEHHPKIGEDTGAARALRARLRRPAAPTEVLAERAVHELAQRLPSLRRRPYVLIELVRILATVEGERDEDGPRERLAERLGGTENGSDRPRLSDIRFQQLIRSDGSDLGTAVRRALPRVGKTCDVAQLADDLLAWLDEDRPERGEKTRINWCFDYFGAARPIAANGPDEAETPGDETQ